MEIYERLAKATEQVERRWLRKAWSDDDGGACIAQSLFAAFGIDRETHILPSYVAEIVDAELMRTSRYYRYYRYTGDDIQSAIVAWNDAWWRKKSHVVSLMRTLTRDQEVTYLRWRVSVLEEQIATLRKAYEVQRHENERLRAYNGRLREIVDNFRGVEKRTAADEISLLDLEGELAETWERLTELNDVRA